ncbi:MAG: DUF2804 domain-containing protein [Oscillospiraceae bacterium]
MQREITQKGNLLDENGVLTQVGYAKSLILDYSRDKIKAAAHRIKEWDYYLVYNNDFALALTVADNSYMSLVSASLLDFNNPQEHTTSLMAPFPMGKLHLPQSSAAGITQYKNKSSRFRFITENGVRKLSCHLNNFKDKKPLYAEIELFDQPQDSMVIATPFDGDKKAFYYNQKIIGMRAKGKAFFDGREYIFNPEDSFGMLDWGRGVWTYKNTWYWGAAQGTVDGRVFGFNIGYGFGNTDAASENMIFYDGMAHKFDRLTFQIPQKDGKDDFMRPWKIVSNDGRFDMSFEPILDRASKTDVLLICSDQHQVFGKFTGSAILDDGKIINIKDFIGFAEKVYNKW